MKRLIALIGAVATAFGLYADPVEYYANSFETTTEGLSQDGTTWSAATPWSTELTDAFKVEAYGQGEPGVYSDVAARRTTMFQAQDTNLNVLKLETGTNTLDLAIGDVTVDPGKFYFDQLVKFTGFEEEPTFAADTKIAVWMSAIETEGTPAVPAQGEPQIKNELGEMVDNPDYVPPVPPSDDYIAGETNLYVQVGTGTAARKVQIKGSFATETWYRITIKSLGNVIDPSTGSQQAGFLVFINGESAEIVDDNKEYYGVPGNLLPTAKDYYDKGLLFTAIDTKSVTLAKVGYQGIGAIDDVILTSTSPDFDTSDEIEIEIGSLALKGAKVIKIGDVTITDQTSIKVKPGDILVSYAANGPYIVRNGDGVKWTVAADGTLVMDTAATIDVIEAAAKITRSGVDTYYAADELDAAIAQVQDGDTVTFLKQCTLLNSAYTIPEGTTIAVAAGGVWTVNVPANGRLINTFGVESDKNITIITLGNRAGLVLSGTIYSGLKSATLLTVDGAVQLGGALTIGAVKEGAQSDEGAVLTVASIRITGTNKITLVGKGKVISGTALTAENFTNAADDLDISYNEETKTYTAQLKGEAPTPAETGFMVIIAGETEGDVYPTLAAAVEAATAGATIKLLSNETVVGKCEITKNITLDLNGKTLARDNNAATLFVIKDATLTINGATAGSTLVGRLNVGDSVYNGGVRTDHWEGALVINGGTYSVGDGQTVIHVNGDCLNAAVTINNATLTSPTDNGVQFNGKGTFAINNSTINGATAVYMKAGTLTIDKDSKINATATTWTAPVANHNGSNPTGDAIVMDSITGYQGAISLTVADGATVTKVAEDAATIRETITDATDSTTVKIDAPTIGGIALTEAFLAKVANGSAQLPGYVATIGTVPYQTLAAAFAAAKNDDTVEMLADVSLAANEKVVIMDKAVTLAGAFTVTAAGRAFNVQKGGTLTISSETTVIGTGKPATIFLWPYDFDSRALTSDDAAHYGKAKLVVNGTVKYTTTGDEGAIASNGNDSIAGSEGVEVIINGTVINACDSALYLPGKGTCTVNDGAYIEGTYAGIQMKAVTLTVNGGTIKATGEDQTPTAPWADGANPSGCAIQMEGNTAYAGGINLTVNGGTIESVNAKAIYAYGAQEKFGTISIAGGTIKGNTGVFLLDQGMNKAIVPGSSKAQFNKDVTAFCEEGYETVKLESAEFYTVRAKQTDPIPPLPAEPTADDVNAKVDAAKFADSTVKTMIGGDPAKYTAFKTWADTVTGGQAAVVASAHAADSYLLGQTTLLENAPVSEIKTIAKTSDTALTLTFEIKDGANAVTVAQTAADYVKGLVQCNEKVDFGNGTKIDATVTVTINGQTLTAAVTLPANKPAAFMKVAK